MVCALSTALSDTDCFNVLNAASLDIVLPCYNPDPDWEKAVIHSFKAICNALQDVAIRLLIVNDGSVLYAGKEAPEAISRAIPFFQWISYYPNKGKGAALREGMRHSDADITIYTDIDFPYQEASLVEIFELLRHGKADVVAGVKDAGILQWCTPGEAHYIAFIAWHDRHFSGHSDYRYTMRTQRHER